MKKKILIINTGGTISSIKTAKGYEPALGYVKTALESIPTLRHEDMPEYWIHEYNPLLDSANMRAEHWNKIACDIAKNYAAFDGFLIFHGTDTMAYTASALSFMLEHLSKPVILTGSQIPLAEVRNDAIDNITTSLWLLAHFPIPEVCIYFNQRLLRGNRAQKISAKDFSAFDSPNYPHLAHIGIDIELRHDLLQKPKKKVFNLQTIGVHPIANLRLFPGFSTDILSALLSLPLNGLILETYGAGNAPNDEPLFLELLEKACKSGLIIVNCSQCIQGRVEMGEYATGFSLKQAGLISGKDLTLEAAHCKLMYLLSKGLEIEDVKVEMQKNLCGELSED